MEEIPMNEKRMTLYKNCVDGPRHGPAFLAGHGKIYATAIRLASCIPAIRLEYQYPNLGS
jgi:hypothetical protein